MPSSINADAAKARMIKAAGFVYYYERELYVNKKTKKVISIDFLEENTEQTLLERINEPTSSDGWQFYFTSGQPTPSIRRQLEAYLANGSSHD